ncbi:MAG: hypothetical protein ACOC8N_07835, partial [Spirochaetota bacterium]
MTKPGRNQNLIPVTIEGDLPAARAGVCPGGGESPGRGTRMKGSRGAYARKEADREAGGAKTACVPPGTSLLELFRKLGGGEKGAVGALFNGRIMGLEYGVNRPCRVRFLDTGTEEGADIYRRSLSVLLLAACRDLFGTDFTLKIEHSLSRGYFFRPLGSRPLTADMADRLQRRMEELAARDLPFAKQEVEVEHALDLFSSREEWDRYHLLKYVGGSRVVLYRLLDSYTLGQGPLVPSTGYLGLFSLVHHPPGLVLLFPRRNTPGSLPPFTEQKKLFQIYSEQRDWSRLLDVDSAGKLNRAIVKGGINNLIWLSEGLHEKKIAFIADAVTRRTPDSRVVFLAGPSSSGKTTFAKRLTIQLMANGISPVVLSLDSYYLPRARMPRDEGGNTDFDSLHALDLELIRAQVRDLLAGKRIEVPGYDFKTGLREPETTPLRLGKNQVIIIEGIHCMNPELTGMVGRDGHLKIYVSALTQLNLDVVNRVPTSSVRLIRRIVRDHQFREFTAGQTLAKWPLVRRGEDRNIFPYQEQADLMFNSALVYE